MTTTTCRYSGPAPTGSYAETGPAAKKVKPPPPAKQQQHQHQHEQARREWIVAPVGATETVCGICGSPDERYSEILLCDGVGCDLEFHMSCLSPPLTVVPEGTFLGPCCSGDTHKSGGGAGAGEKEGAEEEAEEKAEEAEERQQQEEQKRRQMEADKGPARFVLRACDGQKTWIPSLADPRAPRREQIAAGVCTIAEMVEDVGVHHFAIHPKGCGVICATEKTIPANCFVTEYLGAVYVRCCCCCCCCCCGCCCCCCC
jgi:hypothetical protein